MSYLLDTFILLMCYCDVLNPIKRSKYTKRSTENFRGFTSNFPVWSNISIKAHQAYFYLIVLLGASYLQDPIKIDRSVSLNRPCQSPVVTVVTSDTAYFTELF